MQIQIAHIEKAIEKVDNLDDHGLERLAETYFLAQPDLVSYVMAAADEYENANLEGLLIYYYCLISEAFTQAQVKTKRVSHKEIEDFLEPYHEFLDEFFETENMESMDEFSDQPELAQFMSMEVSTPDTDGTTLDDDTATQLYIVCMALITLLSQAQK